MAATLAKLRPGDDGDRAIAAIWVMRPDIRRLLDRQIEHRKERRTDTGTHLLKIIIPANIHARLVGGSYEIIARQQDDKEVSLYARDLVGLDVDLSGNRLLGDGLTYHAVRVRALQRPTQIAQRNPRHKKLLPADEEQILTAVHQVYDFADQNDMKPPNLNETTKAVQIWLRTHGVFAGGQDIKPVASKVDGRLPPGSKAKELMKFSNSMFAEFLQGLQG